MPAPNEQLYTLDRNTGKYYPYQYGSRDSRESPADISGGTRGAGKATAGEVDTYLESKLIHPQYAGDASLERGVQRAKEAEMPDIAVSPLQGQLLTILAKGIKAEKVLEIGTLGGYSTTFLARALPSHGQIDTLEYSPLHAKIAQQNFVDSDLYPFPKVHVGAALDILRDPNGPFAHPPGTQEGLPEDQRGYDLVFIDADKENSYNYLMEALRLTRKGALIMVDNAVRGGRIAQEENKDQHIDVAGLRQMYDWVEKDAGKTVVGTTMQTVGAKYWDGFFLATKL